MDNVDFAEVKISKFSNNSFAVGLDNNGKVYAWGNNMLGQLGHQD